MKGYVKYSNPHKKPIRVICESLTEKKYIMYLRQDQKAMIAITQSLFSKMWDSFYAECKAVDIDSRPKTNDMLEYLSVKFGKKSKFYNDKDNFLHPYLTTVRNGVLEFQSMLDNDFFDRIALKAGRIDAEDARLMHKFKSCPECDFWFANSMRNGKCYMDKYTLNIPWLGIVKLMDNTPITENIADNVIYFRIRINPETDDVELYLYGLHYNFSDIATYEATNKVQTGFGIKERDDDVKDLYLEAYNFKKAIEEDTKREELRRAKSDMELRMINEPDEEVINIEDLGK